MNDYTLEVMSHALSTSLLREEVIAFNIAHCNDPNYHALAVALDNPVHSYSRLASESLIYQTTDDAQIDDQIRQSVENAAQFNSLIKGINEKLALLRIAVGGNGS